MTRTQDVPGVEILSGDCRVRARSFVSTLLESMRTPNSTLDESYSSCVNVMCANLVWAKKKEDVAKKKSRKLDPACYDQPRFHAFARALNASLVQPIFGSHVGRLPMD